MEIDIKHLRELEKYYFDLYNYYLAIGIQGEELHEALMNWIKYDKLLKKILDEK